MDTQSITKESLQPHDEDISKDQTINRLYYAILFIDEDPYRYSSRAKYKVRDKNITRVLKEYLVNRRIKVIDIGSGTGQLMNIVGRALPLIEITCVEPSQQGVKALRDAGGFSVIQSAFPNLSGVNGLYGCATCFDAFYYMKNKEDRNAAAARIYGLLEPNGRFIVDDWQADDIDASLFQLEQTYHFDDETITTSLFFWIEHRHRMLKHILQDSHRRLFERYDFYRNRNTLQSVLGHRLLFQAVYILAKPIVWANRLFIGNVTIQRLLSNVQKHPYRIYVYKKIDTDNQQARP